MSRRRTIRSIALFVGLFLPAVLFASGGNIDSTYDHSRLCANSDCSSYSIVNWAPTHSSVTVSDTGITGYVWSANLGWINLAPSQAGVHNTTSGVLSGYAWGEVGSWVNFSPTFNGESGYHGVQIDPTTGQFSGWAWVENSGWMLFDCSKTDACVVTSWRGSSSTTTTDTGGGGGGGGGGGTTTGGDTGDTGGTTGTTGDTGTTGGDTGSTGTTGATGSTGGSTGSSGGSVSGGGGGVVVSSGTTATAPIVTPPVTVEATSVLSAPLVAVGRAVSAVRHALSSPAAVTATHAVGVVGAAGVTLFTFLLTPWDFLLLPIRLWALFLGAIGLAKKKKPWGTVYDSVTKQPLDPAYVVLRSSEGEDIATAITDLDGRYGFVVPQPGTYTLVANKTNYNFPSQKLVGHDHDELYRDLYFGEHFSIAKAGEVVTRNIPMDPVNFDWNEFAKRDQHLLHFYSNREKWLLRFSSVFFYIGFTVASVSVLLSMTTYNIGIFCLYALLFFVRRYGVNSRPFGTVGSAQGGPVPFAILRIKQRATGVEVMHRVTDSNGHYYALLPNGEYLVRVDRKLPDATYQTVGIDIPAKVTKGYLSQKFTVDTSAPQVPPVLPPTPPAIPPAPATPIAPTLPAPEPLVTNPDFSE